MEWPGPGGSNTRPGLNIDNVDIVIYWVDSVLLDTLHCNPDPTPTHTLSAVCIAQV